MLRWFLLPGLLIVAGLSVHAGGLSGTQVFPDAGAAPTISSGFLMGTIPATNLLDMPEPTPTALAIFGLSGIGLLAMRRSADRD